MSLHATQLWRKRNRRLSRQPARRQLRLEHLEHRRLLSVAPKNVILFIGDGMGFEHVEAANYYTGGDLIFETFPYQAEMTTDSADFSITDSAASATAMATGQKVNNEVVSMAYPGDGSELTTSLEVHKDLGKATGLVTTTYMTHATPAVFGAHEPSRNNLSEIAGDYLNQTRPNVLFGGSSYMGDAASAGYTVVTTAGEMTGLNTETTTYVSGQFGSGYMPYEYDGLGALPHLSEMTATALDILDNDPDGFFMMVEGGRIDHAAHDNDLQRMVFETVEFDSAVQHAFDWAAGRTDTLIIVTSDHETGGLTVTQDNGAGNMPSVTWSSGGHTTANVPIYAWGTNAELVTGVMDNTDVFPLSIGIETVTMVDQGSTWTFWDNGSEPTAQGGLAWYDPGFQVTVDLEDPDETAWQEGPAVLGFGDAHVVTTVSYGSDSSNKYTTTYFRHSFDVADPLLYSDLDFNILRDDGAVVYLNGQEVVRSHMPEGEVFYDTFSSQPAVGGADETTFFPYSIDPARLVSGSNVLAVEIHQCNLTSSDLGFDLELKATELSGPDVTPPTASLATPEDNGPGDLDPNPGAVTVGYGQEAFEVQLSDTEVGIDDATVTSTAVILKRNGSTLVEGVNYTFGYDMNNDLITLIGEEPFDTNNYQIILNSGAALIKDRAGNALAATTFDVVIDRDLAESFSLVMLPDTQKYSQSYPDTFNSQTQWVADHVATENFAFLTHVGDVIEHSEAITPIADQWIRADAAMDILDGDAVTNPDGLIPYSVVPGNHDFDVKNVHDAAGDFTTYFGGYRYYNQYYSDYYDWYLGSVYNTTNHAQVFTAGNQQFLHLGLEWEPRQSAIDWAQGKINDYSSLPVIISTHSYLNGSGRSTGTSDGGYSGEAIFQTLVKPNPQVFMVLCGHVSDEYHQVSYNNAGLEVIEILADYQGRDNGGDGWMRLLEFDPGQNRIDVTTFSPTLDQYETDADSQFSFTLDFDQRFSFAPSGSLMTPLDGGPNDLDPGTEDSVLTNQEQSSFQIRLTDIDNNLDWDSVTGYDGEDPSSSVVEVWKGSSPLIEDTDFTFAKSWSGNDIIVTLTPTAPPFGNGVYHINLNPSNAKIKDLDGNELAFTTLTVEIDTSIVQPQTATFQQGLGGYSGTADTNLLENSPGDSYATAASLTIDTDEPPGTTDDAQALVRFDNVFGGDPGQVPADAAITSATLELQFTNGGDSINLHRMLQAWADTYTWNSFAADGPAGVQAGSEAAATADVSTGSIAIGTLSLDVGASLAAWQASPSSSFGWVLLPTNTNGVDFDSAEGATPPKLIVEYLTGAQNTPPVALNDSYGVDEDNPLNVAVPGVLTNDTDADGDTLSANPLGNVSHGTLTLYSDGAFDYTPDPDFNGTDSFTYTADDGNGGTDTAVVTITVGAINDPPVANSQSVTTDEDTPLPITLTATDADGNELSYAVGIPTHGSLSGEAPNLTYTPDADYYGPDGFTFTVNDGTVDSNEATVSITVNPINDAPVITGQNSLSTPEETALAITLDDLIVTDPDNAYPVDFSLTVLNGTDYTRSGNTITPDTDFNGTLTVPVTVNDGTDDSDQFNLSVTVTAVNDPPVANDDTFSIPENSVNGATVGTVSATDVDPGQSLTYLFTTGNDAGVFAIASTTGLITVFDSTKLDYPTTLQYVLTVEVTDDGAGPLSDTATITINVTEVNQPPVVDDQAFSVDENSPNGTVVDAVFASDPNAGQSLEYAIIAGNEAGAFAIGLTTGDVTVADSSLLDFETTMPFALTIQVTDNGNPTMSDTATITVNLSDVNEAPTAIALSNSSVAENVVGAVVGSVTVSDSDTGDTHTLTVSDERFEVVSGQLKLVAGQSLDYEAEPSVTLDVTATDSGGLELTQGFTISVTDVNEAPTAIALSNSSVAENVAGAVIGSVTVSDPDIGDTHTLTVSDVRFEVVSGQLKLVAGQSLDHELEPSVTLDVTAIDSGGLELTQGFTISVTDVNEAPTAIALSNSSVAENVAGAVIGSVTVSDPDIGDTHTLTVSDVRFEVVSGQLKLVAGQSLDYEAEPSVTLDVTATDSGGLELTQGFTISVTDVNEAPTAIALSNSSVAENVAGAVVGDLTVTDPDVGDSHSLTVSDSRFEIDGSQLKLLDTESLDAAVEPTVTLDVTATDQNGSGLSFEETFTITVTPSVQPVYAIGDLPVFGTVSGTFEDTCDSNSSTLQTITEVNYAGNRSRLEHIWDFGQVDGATKFVVEAYRSDLSVDDFLFEYSTDGVNWTTMIAGVTTTETVHEHVFAAPVSGTMQVRVTDTDRGKERTLDTVSIDEMYFLCQTGPVLPTVTITATDAAAAEEGSDPGVFTVNRTGDLLGDLVVSYTIGGTADGTDYNETLSGSVTILDGTSSATITVTPIDDALDEGNETVMLTLSPDAAYTIGSPDAGTVTIADNDGAGTDDYAIGETASQGTVTGDYTDTHSSNDTYEAIQEQLIAGKFSKLEHIWEFNVAGGSSVTFYVEAFHDSSVEHFEFAYSTDGENWTYMLTVEKAADDDTPQTYQMPALTSGTVFVHVIDTDHAKNERVLDTISIDEMFFRSDGTAMSSAENAGVGGLADAVDELFSSGQAALSALAAELDETLLVSLTGDDAPRSAIDLVLNETQADLMEGRLLDDGPN